MGTRLQEATAGKAAKITYRLMVVLLVGLFAVASASLLSAPSAFANTLSPAKAAAPAKAKITSVSGGVAKLTVKVASAKRAVGYQYKVALDSKFKKQVSTKTTTKKSAVFKELAEGKKYYVKARAYAKSGKSKVYGAWSKTKTAKTKVDKTVYKMATGGEAGTYYAFGSVIASHATKSGKINVKALASNGSTANLLDIEAGRADFAFCQSDILHHAANNTKVWKQLGSGTKCANVRTVAGLYEEPVQIVTCNSNLKTVADLKGKRVSLGAAGSGVYYNAIDILGAYGIGESDIVATYQGFADSAYALRSGLIDAAFVVAGAPTTAVTDLALTKRVSLVSMDAAHIKKLIAKKPYYHAMTIPAGTYAGQGKAAKVVSVTATLVARKGVSNNKVRALVADILDNSKNLVGNHQKYAEVSVKKGASIKAAPYHKGAAAYFAKKGYKVTSK